MAFFTAIENWLQRKVAARLMTTRAVRGLPVTVFSTNPSFSPAQVAATFLHEAMHARLHRLGFPLDYPDRARHERFCRRAELEFGCIVPGGGPIVARALETLRMSDAEVAPVIDHAPAARRVALADREALRAHREKP